MRRIRARPGSAPAQHGPEGSEHLTGPVIGFHLAAPGEAAVHVSGDNASLDVVRGIAERFGPVPVAVLHAGAARLSYVHEHLTLPAGQAAKAARILGARHVVPVPFDGWAHLTEGAGELRAAFADAGLAAALELS